MDVSERSYTFEDMRAVSMFARLEGAPATVEEVIRDLDAKGKLSPDHQRGAVDPSERRPDRNVEYVEVDCPSCRGRGYVQGASKAVWCDKCDGRGRVSQPRGAVDADELHATGAGDRARERIASLMLDEPSKTAGLYAAIDELQREAKRLREALEGQWTANHAQHCEYHAHDPNFPCRWPRPEALDA